MRGTVAVTTPKTRNRPSWNKGCQPALQALFRMKAVHTLKDKRIRYQEVIDVPVRLFKTNTCASYMPGDPRKPAGTECRADIDMEPLPEHDRPQGSYVYRAGTVAEQQAVNPFRHT